MLRRISKYFRCLLGIKEYDFNIIFENQYEISRCNNIYIYTKRLYVIKEKISLLSDPDIICY